MKFTPIVALTACTAFFMLSACGQRNEANDAQKPAAVDVSEMAPAAVSADRDWMPAAIILPQPHTMIQNTRIGTRTNYLQVIVQKNPTPEFAKWKSALLAAGYEVNDNIANGTLLFEKQGVESGKIAVSQPEDQEGFMIQVDVSSSQ